jgi:hypothetical protein
MYKDTQKTYHPRKQAISLIYKKPDCQATAILLPGEQGIIDFSAAAPNARKRTITQQSAIQRIRFPGIPEQSPRLHGLLRRCTSRL